MTGDTGRQSRRVQRDCIDLCLYVTNQTPPCRAAFANLRQICDTYLKGRYRITVIDLEKAPDLARTEGILAIPTLVRESPGGKRRKVIGTLDNAHRVLSALGLVPQRNGYPGVAPMGRE
jgi:circadian clock protein KaiB